MHDGWREHDAARDLYADPVAGVERTDSATVVQLAGELDLHNADVVRAALLDAVDGKPQRLVVDLRRVRFVDSTALGVLVEARTKLENRYAFLLAAPGLEARRALEVSGLDRHFAVHETVDEAIAASV